MEGKEAEKVVYGIEFCCHARILNDRTTFVVDEKVFKTSFRIL